MGLLAILGCVALGLLMAKQANAPMAFGDGAQATARPVSSEAKDDGRSAAAGDGSIVAVGDTVTVNIVRENNGGVNNAPVGTQTNVQTQIVTNVQTPDECRVQSAKCLAPHSALCTLHHPRWIAEVAVCHNAIRYWFTPAICGLHGRHYGNSLCGIQ